MTIPANADVVVVGAGFAGLSAARELVRLRPRRRWFSKGRDRVGGRSSTTTLAGTPVDLGGTFVGPDPGRRASRWPPNWAATRVPTYSRGKNLIRWRGEGAVVPQHHPEAVDHRVARRLPDPVAVRPRDPAGAGARSRGRRRLPRTWTPSRSTSGCGRCTRAPSTRDLMAIMARVTWGCEPDEVSMLHAVRYVKAAGGLDRMLDVKGGAQQDRFPDGTQQIALRMAEELGARVVLDAVVRSIERRTDGSLTVDMRTAATSIAKAVIVAIPPEHRAGHRVRSGAAARVRQARPALAAGQPEQGLRRLRDTVLARERLLGRGAVRRGAGLHHLRRQPGDDGPGILLGFTDARTFDPLPPAERRERALAGLRDAVRRRRTAIRSTTSTTAGAQSNSRRAGRRPRCRPARGRRTARGCANRSTAIHWAGTETADKWTGFLDGAVRSGQRAADEVRPGSCRG